MITLIRRLIILLFTILPFTVFSQDKDIQEKVIFISASQIDYSAEKTVFDNGEPSQKTGSFGVLSEISYGRWKKNRLFFYGISVLYQTSFQQADDKTQTLAILPTLGYQMRFDITNKLYLTPYGKLQVGPTKQYYQQNPQSSKEVTNGMLSGLFIQPVSVTIQATKNMSLLFSLGSFSTIYRTYSSDPEPGQSGYKNYQFTIQAKLNSIGLGAQFKL